MGALNESSPYLRAQANLSELKLDRMSAAMPDYVRMVADGDRDFAQAMVLASIYFSPFSPTHFRQSRQRGCAAFGA